MFNFDEISRKNKEAFDTALRSYSEIAKGFQAIATETGDYSKKSFEDLTSFFEQLVGVKSVESLYELQTKFAKSSYEGFVAEATKISSMYADLAKTAYKPYEAPVARATAVVTSAAA
ncbi:Phasin protein [Rhizobium sp. RU35A]|uniref:Phasin family protein n=1 Tax=Rhizobium straminoryzae TaxID=1387186 RepID=A0A549TFZ9_9HYPH|nr:MULTISPECIES: phasin family protein [Rhizobium]TRL41532.1 phasin family protein [Rhizobium straminoryzae]SIQ78854.1 Phasin protein [Rhizobium sp. RU35A]